MATEYIEKQAARPDEFCVGVSCQECPFLKDPLYGGCRVDDFIMALPPADVRPVVLCGDCRWFDVVGYPDPYLDMPELRTGHCFILGRDVHACWFCGAGEQKEDANSLTEALKRNTTEIEEKANVIRAEYIRHLQENNKALDEELASLREAFLQATRGGRVDAD